jgi:hypothetical protein
MTAFKAKIESWLAKNYGESAFDRERLQEQLGRPTPTLRRIHPRSYKCGVCGGAKWELLKTMVLCCGCGESLTFSEYHDIREGV